MRILQSIGGELRGWVSVPVALLMSGCITTGPTLQEQVRAQQMMMATMAQSSGARRSYADTQQGQGAAPQLTATTEPALKAEIDALPALANGVLFERKRDGFDVNGIRYIDSEGEIVSYGTDYATGDVTYLASTGSGEFVLKYVRVLTDAEPISIATAKQDRSGWQIKLATGKTIRGDRIIPMSRGVVITRATTAFRYVPGDGIKNFSAVDGWHIASFQNGDVSSTGYILLEKDPVKKGGLGELLSSAKALGSTLGLTQKHDYMLVHVDSGKAVPFDIAMDGKQQTFLTNCYQKSAFVRYCNDGYSAESLWDRNGVKNFEHYYWRVQWLNSPRGPVAVVQEHGLMDITITDLRTDEKATLFSRALGIGAYDVAQAADGTVSVVAKMGLTAESVPDAIAFLNQNGVVPAVADGGASE